MNIYYLLFVYTVFNLIILELNNNKHLLHACSVNKKETKLFHPVSNVRSTLLELMTRNVHKLVFIMDIFSCKIASSS